MLSVITVSGVTFEFANGREIFKNLNFTLEPKLTALVGPNGVGKTCLARLLTGDLEPTEGSIRRRSSFTFFAQREIPQAISVHEYLALDYNWSPLGEQLLDGVNRESLCTNLSGGEWMRVRLARAMNGQFLVLDEPTNDLDREGRKALLEFLRESKGGALLISHDRECLELCKEVLELSNQGLMKFGGKWSDYQMAKLNERENLADDLESAKRERDQARINRAELIARQEKRSRHGRETALRGGMPKILTGARKRRAQVTTGKVDSSTIARANEAVRDAYEAYSRIKIDPQMYVDLSGQKVHSQKLVVEVKNFNVRYHQWLYNKDLNFVWRGSIRIALKGKNGSGKSTLLKALLGLSLETRGELRRGNLTTLCLDQRCAILNDQKSIFENIRDVSHADESEIRGRLAKFLFAGDMVFQKVSTLSGGERLRAALAKGLLRTEKPELLVLDEPTNNLDLTNIKFLEDLVCKFKGALVVISHDEVFLKNCGIDEEFILS